MLLKIVVVCVLIISLPSTFSKCRQSYATICDSFEDLEKYGRQEKITELIIGSDDVHDDMTSVDLMKTLTSSLYIRPTSLVIIRKINELKKTSLNCMYSGGPLQYLFFYGNELKRIDNLHFPRIPLKKLSLVNNKIETIRKYSFYNHKIMEFDASNNLLEEVERHALPFTEETKIINLGNNKITHIEMDSFPKSLHSLKLDKNKLRYLQEGTISELIHLEDLDLSYNKFKEIPKIQNLKNLIIFDISYNEISFIPEEKIFESMENLTLLELGGNKISEISLNSIILPGKQPSLTISLAMNRLSHLNVKDLVLEQQKFILYGNPWECETWDKLQEIIANHVSKCDLNFFSSGEAPFCFKFGTEDPWNVDAEVDVAKFHQIVSKHVDDFHCKLNPDKYVYISKNVEFSCVL